MKRRIPRMKRRNSGGGMPRPRPTTTTPAFIRLDPALKDMFRKNPRLATAYWNIVRTHGLESESSRAAAVAADAAAVAAVGDSRTLETRRGRESFTCAGAGSRRATTRGSSSSPSGCDTRTIRACSHGGADGVYRLRMKDLPPQALLQRPRVPLAVICSRAPGRAPPRRTTRAGRRAADAHRPRGGSRRGARRAEGFRRRDQGRVGSRERRRPRGSSRPDDDVDRTRMTSRTYCSGARARTAIRRRFPAPTTTTNYDDDVPGRDPLHARCPSRTSSPSPSFPCSRNRRCGRRAPRAPGDVAAARAHPQRTAATTPTRGRRRRRGGGDPSRRTRRRWRGRWRRRARSPRRAARTSCSPRRVPGVLPGARHDGGDARRRGRGCAAIAARRGPSPARLVTRVETAAIDELLAAAVPGPSKVTLAALDVLGRPSSKAECAAAERLPSARHAAEGCGGDDAAAATSRSPSDAARMTMEARPGAGLYR